MTNVLIVEDHVSMRESLTTALTAAGVLLRMTPATTGISGSSARMRRTSSASSPSVRAAALAGAAARADPVHARVQEAADLPLGARGVEPPRLVKGGDQRRDNPFDCLDHATASFAIR